jgi:putative ABC transport system ATP-binding protein
MIELKDIRKSYPLGPLQIEVLKGVSLEIRPGDLLSIMGSSGSGKSTLMNIIGLLDNPTSGTYVFGEDNVLGLSDQRLSIIRNRNIGFVFQQFQLLPRLSALDNVGIPLVYRGTPVQARRKLSLEHLEKVGMADRAHHKPSELSGGQQQRVAIARALVGKPSIILADEPTGALDTRVGQEVMDLFKELNAKEGITIIIITHDAKVAAQCVRRVVMNDGLLTDST